MAYLKYDTDKMRSVKDTYNKCIISMDSLQSGMLRSARWAPAGHPQLSPIVIRIYEFN